MILVRNEDDLVVRYAEEIAIDGNCIKVFVETCDNPDNIDSIDKPELYTIYDVDVPATDRNYKYINGEFIEWDMLINQPAVNE